MLNQIDLASERKTRPGPRFRREIVLRAIGPTLASEIVLRRGYMQFLRATVILVKKNIMPLFASTKEQLAVDSAPFQFTMSMRVDVRDTVRELGAFTRLFQQYIDKNLPQYNKLVEDTLAQEEIRYRNQLTTAVRASTGIEIGPILRSADVRPQIEATTMEFAQLIKGISDDMAKNVSTMVLREAQRGTRAPELAKMLSAEFGFTAKRAKLIARDQLASFNASMNRIRQQQLGGDEYVWSNSQDERVRGNPDGKYPKARPSHWDRDGKVYSWDDPPSDGHPGEPINCRCVARMVIK